MTRDEHEDYCLERLGLANARGEVAEKIRAAGPTGTSDDLLARPLSSARFLVVDLETTGSGPDRARIIEIGAVEVDGFVLGRELGSLIYSRAPIPFFIQKLTGIDAAMILKAPRLPEVLPLLERMLKGRVLVAHNLGFDLSFLDAAWRETFDEDLDAPTLCTVKLARRAFPELAAHNLDAIAAHLGIRPDRHGVRGRHRALGDARITAAALIRMTRRLEREGMESVAQLIKFQNSRKALAGRKT